MKNSFTIHYRKKSYIESKKIILLSFTAFVFFFFNSCRKDVNVKCKDCLILHASLEEKKVPLEKLFNKIELIPLETTDRSLIAYIDRYNYLNGKHYILDKKQVILFIFDEKGQYLNRIAKKGQGPGEYTLIYDFSVNLKKEQIEMLSPYGFIFCYDFNGNFIKKFDLTFLKSHAFHSMEILDDENYILWSTPEDNEDGIRIVSQETGKVVNSFWQDLFIINSWASNTFYTYNNDTYFSLSLYNTVYKVTKEGIEDAYEWHFGDKTVDISKHNISTGMYNANADYETLMQKLENNEILYDFRFHFQNSQYYYAQIRFGGTPKGKWKSLFYNKKTKENFLFENIIEGLRLMPLYFSDEYIIDILRYKDKEKLLNCTLLDESNKKKLLDFKEDDNPYLIKYYFR